MENRMNYYYNSSIITIRNAAIGDVPAIEYMYRKIAITKDNYKTALPEGNGTFTSRGGMFEISSAGMIRERLEDENQFVLVAEVDGVPMSMLWYGKVDQESFKKVIPFSGQEEQVAYVLNRLKENNLGCANEIISLKSSCSRVIPYLLNLEMINSLMKIGLEEFILEIYRIDGYRDVSGYHRSGLFNRASANIIEKNGGVKIGYLPQKNVSLDGYQAEITPIIYFLNCRQSKDIILDLLSGRGCTHVG